MPIRACVPFYITLTLNDFIKNSIYQDTQDTDLIKITENGKEYKLHDYRNNIEWSNQVKRFFLP